MNLSDFGYKSITVARLEKKPCNLQKTNYNINVKGYNTMKLNEYKTMVKNAMDIYELACKTTILKIIRKHFNALEIDINITTNKYTYYLKTLSVEQFENDDTISNEELEQYDKNADMLELIAYQTADKIYNYFWDNDIDIEIDRSVYSNGEIQFKIDCDQFDFDIRITNRYFEGA